MSDGYDLSHLDPFIEPFINLDPDEPFFEASLEHSYGSLWKFKDHVEGWSIVVSRYQKFVRILHKEKNSPRYLDLCVVERVKVIEEHHGSYIVVVVGAVDQESECDLTHVHSIVIEVGKQQTNFDSEPLIDSLIGTSGESLKDEIQKVSWKNPDGSPLKAVALGRRLSRVFLTLTHFITDTIVAKAPPMPLQSAAVVSTRDDSATPSRGNIQQWTSLAVPTPAKSRASKRSGSEAVEDGAIKKKRKKTAKAGSSGSVLTQTEETKKTKKKD